MSKNIKDYNEKQYNVAWLKRKLQEALDNLDYYDDEELVEIKTNTYWVGPNFISFGSLGFVDLDEPVKEKEEFEDSAKDSNIRLEVALKMEKDTISQYQAFKRMAGDGDEPENMLWDHLIADEEEHVEEIEAAMKGDYSKITAHDAGTTFQQSVDGVAKLLREKKLQENVSFAEGDQSYKTVLVETPVDKFDEVLEALKEEYKIDSHNGKNRIFVKIKDAVSISVKSPEQVQKEQERDETFRDRINDVLVDGGIDYKAFRITNEDRDFYVDFDSNKEDAKKAYRLLRDKLFECNFVEDEGFYYIHVLRR